MATKPLWTLLPAAPRRSKEDTLHLWHIRASHQPSSALISAVGSVELFGHFQRFWLVMGKIKTSFSRLKSAGCLATLISTSKFWLSGFKRCQLHEVLCCSMSLTHKWLVTLGFASCWIPQLGQESNFHAPVRLLRRVLMYAHLGERSEGVGGHKWLPLYSLCHRTNEEN